MMGAKAVAEAAARVRAARRVFVLTGAGISAESGIPTFRDAMEGLWAKFDPMTLASPEGFASDPALVWEWYAGRLAHIQKAEPNAGHHAIAALERRVPATLVLTQNVDGLHQRAGSRNVHEIHGSIHRARCTETGRVYQPDELPIRPPFPIRTPEGHLARPDVVWFGEMADRASYMAAEKFLREAPPDVALIVGTTGMFPYVQGFAMTAWKAGATLIEVNPTPSPLAEMCRYVIEGKAGEVLPELVGK